MRIFFCFAFLSFLFYSCGETNKKVVTQDSTSIQKATPTPINESAIKEVGNGVLTALKSDDYNAFSAFISPSKGVLFSPYGYIEPKTSKKLMAKDFLEAIDRNWILTWGNYDGTGAPIKLTVKEYLTKFVYNADYLNAERTAVNKIIGEGNSINNLQQIFPTAEFIEYHFNGFDTQYKGMDWKSLRLVFNEENGKVWLIAVVHDQWTI